MSKLYIYGIGGTGARVLRSLTMLLASGVSLGKNIDTIVPVIVDPDTSNGDLTRTVGLMQLYQRIREHLSFDNRPEKRGYFFTQIDDMGTNFRLHLNNVANMRFGDYIAYNRFTSEGHADPNQALFSLLFSDSNLNCPLDVGFKGNPNMGAIVLNDPMNTESLVSLLQNFQSGDKLFIISSIFGGTGAAGFPLFQKTFREAEALDIPNSSAIANAPIGAVSVLPYFGLKDDKESQIKMETFISKTKAALKYYIGNLDVDALYYVCDAIKNRYNNVEGATEQRNKAHFVELAAALGIVDFCRSDVQHQRNGTQTSFREFGVQHDFNPLTLSELGASTFSQMGREMISFYLFSRFYLEHFNETKNYAWAKTNAMKNTSYSDAFFIDLGQFADAYRSQWLKELSDNQRSFQPFELYTNEKDVFDTIKGIEPRKTSMMDRIFGKNLQGYPAIDTEISDVSMKRIKGLDAYNFFMTVHETAINNVIKRKYNI